MRAKPDFDRIPPDEVLRQSNRITLIGALINIVLALIKIIAGRLTGSLSLLADGLHSLSDLITDGIVVVGAYLGERPPDEDHPYGHGKFATASAIFISLALIAVGGEIVYHSAVNLSAGPTTSAGWLIITIAGFSVVSKEALFQATKIVARRIGNPALLANAWHHRSDSFSSIAVIAGAVATQFGFPYGDSIAGLVVGAMIAAVGLSFGLESFSDLLEKSVERESIDVICEVLDKCGDISEWHKLRTRRVGREIFLDVHILVDPEMNVYDSHEIATSIEHEIKSNLPSPANIVIHIEPFDDKNKLSELTKC